MKKHLIWLAVLVLLLLAGCKSGGTPLPEGMDEDTVLTAGQEVAELILARDWQAVYDQFREDIRETVTADQIQNAFEEKLDKAGELRNLDDSRTQGSADPELQGIAELYYKCAKKTVRFRIAFDTDMNLIGMDPPKLI